MPTKIPITVAHGDGIGPEIMEATLQILEAAGAPLDIETIEIGEKVYLRGNTAGIEPSAWESLRRTKVFLKAPITTPQGGGFKSLNVTMRKTLGLYANVRPCVSYHPFVETKHPNMDVVIVRENEEDLYAGIEYRQTPEVMQCLKLISRPGSEKIVRYAFEYARQHNRKKVTCFTKDNIMKMTDGLFHKVFDEIAAEYPDIENEALDRRHRRGQAGRHARSVRRHRDAQSVRRHPLRRGRADRRLGGTGRIGQHRRAVRHVRSHPRLGAAPRRPEPGQSLGPAAGRRADAGPHRPAGSRRARPQRLAAHHRRRHPHLRHLHEGISTAKGRHARSSPPPCVRASGRSPTVSSRSAMPTAGKSAARATAAAAGAANDELVGIDVFVYWPSRHPGDLAAAVGHLASDGLRLQMIDNRGVKVWPAGMASGETFCTDSFRCRFMSENGTDMGKCIGLLQRIADAGIEIAVTQSLRTFDGQAGFTLAQGQ